MANSGYGTDITNQQAGNYAYDPIGNMVSDIAGGITGIAWTVYGKIQSVAKASGTVNYTYDASGNRISKVANGVETWYVRDATGNVMATYTKGDLSINSGNLTQAEVDLYGSSRLGLLNTSVNCSNNGNGPTALGNAWDATYNRGQKLFELTNHLGNVLATVTDRLVPVPDASNTLIDHNLADVASANDYYSFGMAMPGRSYSAGNQYRYGFNGKEGDGETGYIDYGERMYDPARGQFITRDPLTAKYPWLTPYQFASNSPIWAVDIDGLEGDKKTDPANQPAHPIQTIEDGYGDYIKRTYSVNLDTKVTAGQIFNEVSTNFAKFTVGVSYFERIKGKGGASIGDEWAITGGPDFHSSPVSAIKAGFKDYPGSAERLLDAQKDAVDEKAGVYYSSSIHTGVTVKSINHFKGQSIESFSFTFSTWKGHVEAGEITFTVLQIGTGDNALKNFSIVSNSRSSNFFTDKAYRFLGGQEGQTKHWETFLKNLLTTTGSTPTTPTETTEKSETPIKEKEQPTIKQEPL